MAGILGDFLGLGGTQAPTPGLLDAAGYMDPAQYDRMRQSQSMMGLWAGLLAGGGPSLSPRNFGSALGAGLTGAQQFGSQFDESQLHSAQAAQARANVGKLAAETGQLGTIGKLQEALISGKVPMYGPGGSGGAAAPGAGSSTPNFGTGAGGSGSDPRGVEPYIRAEAARLNIDPDIAVRVARSEGLGTFLGDGGKSGGAFQLYTGGGVGNMFERDTGLSPLDPANEKATITYALQHAAKNGWGDWNGAKKIGITGFAGIGQRGGAPATTTELSAVPDFAGMFAGNQGASYAPAGPAPAPSVLTAPGGNPNAQAAPGAGAALTQQQQNAAALAQTGRPLFPPGQKFNSRGEAISPDLTATLPGQRSGANILPAVVQGFARANAGVPGAPVNVRPLAGDAAPAGPPVAEAPIPPPLAAAAAAPVLVPGGRASIPAATVAPAAAVPAGAMPPAAAPAPQGTQPSATPAGPMGALPGILQQVYGGGVNIPQMPAVPIGAAPAVPPLPTVPGGGAITGPGGQQLNPQYIGLNQALALGYAALGKTVPGFVSKAAELPLAGAQAGAEAAARQPFKLQEMLYGSALKQVEQEQGARLDVAKAAPIAAATAMAQLPAELVKIFGKSQAELVKDWDTPHQIKTYGPDGVERTVIMTPRQMTGGLAPGAALSGGPAGAAPGAAGPAPVPGIVTGLGPQRTAELEARGKGLGTDYAKINTDATAARSQIADLKTMQSNAQNLAAQGIFADNVQFANRVINGVTGQQADRVAAYELVTKNSEKLIRDATRQSDSQPAAIQLVMTRNSMPTPSTSVAGFDGVVGQMLGAQQYTVYKQQAAEQWLADPRHNNSLQGFENTLPVSPYAFMVNQMPDSQKAALAERLRSAGPAGAAEAQALAAQIRAAKAAGF